MARKGLGKGLDSLIPDFYNEDFDSNSPQSLEDMLNENGDSEDADTSKNEEAPEKENIFDQIEKETESEKEESLQEEEKVEEEVSQNDEDIENGEASEDISSDISGEESVQTPQEIKIQKNM